MHPGRSSVQLNLSPEDRHQLAILLVYLEGEVGEATYGLPGFLGTKLGHDKFGFGPVGASRVMEKLLPSHLKQSSVTPNFYWFNEGLRALITPQVRKEFLQKKYPHDKARLSMTRAFLRSFYLKTSGGRSIDPADPMVLNIARELPGFRGRDEASIREELLAFQLYDSCLVDQPGGKFGIGRLEPEWDQTLKNLSGQAAAPKAVPTPPSPKSPPSPTRSVQSSDWKSSLGSVRPVASDPPAVSRPPPVVVPVVTPSKEAPVVAAPLAAIPPPAPAGEVRLPAPAAPNFEERLAALEKKYEDLVLRQEADLKLSREELNARDAAIKKAHARITALEEEVAQLKMVAPAPQPAAEPTQSEEADMTHFVPKAEEDVEASSPVGTGDTQADTKDIEPPANPQTISGPAERVGVEDDGNSSVFIGEASDRPSTDNGQPSKESWYNFVKQHPRFRQWSPPTVLYLFTQGEKFSTLDAVSVWERHFGDRRKVTTTVGNWQTARKVRTERMGVDKRLGRTVEYVARDFQEERRLLDRLLIEFNGQSAAA